MELSVLPADWHLTKVSLALGRNIKGYRLATNEFYSELSCFDFCKMSLERSGPSALIVRVTCQLSFMIHYDISGKQVICHKDHRLNLAPPTSSLPQARMYSVSWLNMALISVLTPGKPNPIAT